MKRNLLSLLVLVSLSVPAIAQVGIGTKTPDASAMLDVKSSSQGMLIPRMTMEQRDAIVSPAVGLMIYQTNAPSGFYYYDGSGWTSVWTSSDGIFRLGNDTIGWMDSYNVFWGMHAGNESHNNYFNVGIGNGAMDLATGGIANVAIGRLALSLNRANANVAVGSQALQNNIAGTMNTANGFQSLFANNSGSSNTAIGAASQTGNESGSYNTSIGHFSLTNNRTGNNNIAIGYYSGTASNNLSNTISIGNDDWPNGASNQAFIGNSRTNWIGGWKAWSVYSDARIKSDIKEDIKGLDFILKLRPISYVRNMQAAREITGNKETAKVASESGVSPVTENGFIAQEVELAAKEANYQFSGLHVPNDSKQLYSLSYESFVVPLVKAVQEQQAVIEAQKELIKKLEKRVEALESKK